MPAKKTHMPTIGKRRLARELVGLREAVGKTQEDVASALDWARGKVSNFENGQWTRASLTDLRAMLDLYGVDSEERRASLMQLMQDAKKRGWWRNYSDVFLSQFPAFEDEAAEISTYEPNAIPGLLQTSDYALALTRANPAVSGQESARKVEARMQRQQLLEREKAPTLLAVIEESTLRHITDSPALFRDQVQHLIELAEADNTVTVQIVPMDSGLHAAIGTAFVIMDFEGDDELSIVYIETALHDLYLEEKAEVSYYRTLMNHLCGTALSPRQSIAEMKKMHSSLS